MPGPSADVWTWEKLSGVKFILRLDIYFALGFLFCFVLLLLFFLKKKKKSYSVHWNLPSKFDTQKHTHSCAHETSWPLAKEKVRSSGREPAGLRKCTCLRCEHIHRASTPESAITGLWAVTRAATEKPQPQHCLGFETKADFSSIANTFSKAFVHNSLGELIATRWNWNQGYTNIPNMDAETRHRNIQKYLNLHKNVCIGKAALNLHS